MSMAEGPDRRPDQKEAVESILKKLREIAQFCQSWHLGAAAAIPWSPPELRGYAGSTLYHAVYKSDDREGFAEEQAAFMKYLGTIVCPEILIVAEDCYCMKYMNPATAHPGSLILMENLLKYEVWPRDPRWITNSTIEWPYAMKRFINVEVPDWALDTMCVIHGDPTVDNVLRARDGSIRISDPIPPRFLLKPSIRAVDHGKMLQSFLGWEVVMRGIPFIEYAFPKFMFEYDTARRAVFWAMVALKRLAYRNKAPAVTEWAVRLAKELEEICM